MDFYAADDASGEAAAEFWRLNFHFGGFCYFCRAFGGLWQDRFERQFIDGAEFAGDSVMAEAIGAVRADFGIDDGTVGPVFDAADICAGERKTRGDLGR